MACILRVFCLVAAVAAVPALGEAALDEGYGSAEAPLRVSSPEPSSDPGRQTTWVRLVDGAPVPPFGCLLASADGTGFSWAEGFFAAHLAAWPAGSEAPAAELPLFHGKWTGGPYNNASGQRWVAQINAWYRDGAAAGLTQDTFRSFDNGHSGIRMRAYPQMNSESAAPSFGAPCKNGDSNHLLHPCAGCCRLDPWLVRQESCCLEWPIM